MNRIHSAWRNLLRGREVDRESDAELESYLDYSAADYERQGLTHEAAARAARAEMGSAASVREQVFHVRAGRSLETLWRDVTYGWRGLRRNPGTSAVAIASLALGIGANTAIFGVVDALMLRPLPVRDPAALVGFQRTELGADAPADILDDARFPYPDFQAYRNEPQVFAGVAAVLAVDRSNVRADYDRGAAATGRVPTALVSGGYFSTIGIEPALGRLFSADDDDARGREPVAVISDSYWRLHFGHTSDIIGRRIALNGVAYAVIGVTPRGFVGDWVNQPTEVWLPIGMQSQVMVERPDLLTRTTIPLVRIVARLRPGVTRETAVAAINTIYLARRGSIAPDRRMTAREMKDAASGRLTLTALSRGFSPERQTYGRAVLLAAGTVGLVLLIACANVASLLLARATAREREVAVRLALGSGPARIVRQLLTESLLLSAIGGGVAALLAWWASSWLASVVRASEVIALDVRANARMFATAGLLALLTGLLFGLAPALTALRPRLIGVLVGRGTQVIQRRFGALQALVIVQVAVSVVLTVAATLFLRTLHNLRSEGVSTDRGRVLMAWIPASEAGRQGIAVANDLDAIRDRTAQLPNVTAASASSTAFFGGGGGESPITIPGHVRTDDEEYFVRWHLVTPGFFETMNIPMLAGRDFRAGDLEASARVAVINDAMARHYFGTASAVGRRFGMRRDTGNEIEIVGVVRNAAIDSPRTANDRVVYLPYRQDLTHLTDMALFVRASGDPAGLAGSIRAAIHDVDPLLPVLGVSTIDDALDRSLLRERVVTDISATFGAVAIALTCIGLFGVMSYLTARRAAEFGVRRALGASSASLVMHVVRDGWTLVLSGIAIGTPAAMAASRAIAGQLFGVAPTDGRAVGTAAALMVVVAAVGTIAPAIRATRVDPLIALRQD
jgi:predicted permease